MTDSEFSVSIDKLRTTFDKTRTIYTEFRVAKLWDMVRDMPDGWMHRITDHMIMLRQAPLGPEFREAVTAAQRAKAFYETNEEVPRKVPDEVGRELFGMIKELMARKAPKAEWDALKQYAETVTKPYLEGV